MSALDLLSDFPPTATEAWEEAIRQDLKGAGYADKLIWRSPEGIAVRPYYRAEDLASLAALQASPGEFPYRRGLESSGEWRIREEVDETDPERANRAACSAVAAGAQEIAFHGVSIVHPANIDLLLAGLGEIPVQFHDADPAVARMVGERSARRPHQARISVGVAWVTDPNAAADLLCDAPSEFVPFTIDATEWQESGVAAAEEIGFALASGVDMVAHMQQRGVAVQRAAEAVTFSFAIGPEFFFEIAKLRAFRLLWARAMEAFGTDKPHSRARVYARTARWNRTVYDPHVNLLRGTMETIAAALGGAESICVAPYDECYRIPDEASRRWARNTQVLLKEEALLARVADPCGGSYLLETLTDALAAKAWKLLQEIEAAGGFRKAAGSGMVHGVMEQRGAARIEAIAARRRVLTGTNRFANPIETALDKINSVPLLNSGRAAQPFEQLRLRTERHARHTGKTPCVLLAEIGDHRMRSARSNFAADLLACAGFAIRTERFENVSEIDVSQADMVVLCSSDPEYLALATELCGSLRDRGIPRPVLVAGNPDTAEQLKAAGVEEFLHLRSKPVELLARLQERLGIKD